MSIFSRKTHRKTEEPVYSNEIMNLINNMGVAARSAGISMFGDTRCTSFSGAKEGESIKRGGYIYLNPDYHIDNRSSLADEKWAALPCEEDSATLPLKCPCCGASLKPHSAQCEYCDTYFGTNRRIVRSDE